MKERSLEQIIGEILGGRVNYNIQRLTSGGVVVKSESIELLVYLARSLFSFPYVAPVLSLYNIHVNIREKYIQIF